MILILRGQTIDFCDFTLPSFCCRFVNPFHNALSVYLKEHRYLCSLVYVYTGQGCITLKKDKRRMERTLSMNYPVLRQNKRVLLYTFIKNHSLYYFFVYISSIYPFLPLVLMYSDEI